MAEISLLTASFPATNVNGSRRGVFLAAVGETFGLPNSSPAHADVSNGSRTGRDAIRAPGSEQTAKNFVDTVK
jgi:hypothetical protein